MESIKLSASHPPSLPPTAPSSGCRFAGFSPSRPVNVHLSPSSASVFRHISNSSAHPSVSLPSERDGETERE
ncbi:hypothetical protein INR49_005471 [Caranx melampygus]|nr:hypothetical protein INR49_005471 [Caranx melampygus]